MQHHVIAACLMDNGWTEHLKALAFPLLTGICHNRDRRFTVPSKQRILTPLRKAVKTDHAHQQLNQILPLRKQKYTLN